MAWGVDHRLSRFAYERPMVQHPLLRRLPSLLKITFGCVSVPLIFMPLYSQTYTAVSKSRFVLISFTCQLDASWSLLRRESQLRDCLPRSARRPVCGWLSWLLIEAGEPAHSGDSSPQAVVLGSTRKPKSMRKAVSNSFMVPVWGSCHDLSPSDELGAELT